MSSDFYSRDDPVERGPIPLDIDNVHMLLQVEQEQIQKKTFTNWVNAQLAKRRPPCLVVDLFNDFRDGSKLLDLLEVMSSQRISRERGRGMFQHRSNIEKALSFLKNKSIKLVNINIPDIIDGKPSIILGLIWTIILQYHIEELASALSFSSRQSSMESLTSLDSRSTLSSRSASSSPLPPRGSPLHNRFRVSAKKALLLWVREQCHKAGCTINVKDFKASWRSGVVFLAILHALRPDLVDLSKARTRSNKQNLEEAFRIAERELRIPRLLDPDDVDVRDPDEKSIMTYVAQFLQYSRDLPASEEEMQTQYLTPKSPSPVNLPAHYTPAIAASPLRQATPDRKAKEVTCWLVQAYDELLEGWDSTEGESYSERYHVFHTFLVSFNEQRRPIMPLLTAMRRTPTPSEEQRALREAWDALTVKLREYKVELDMSLPAPLNTVARWLLKSEGALAEEVGDPQDHGRAADEAREKQELLKVCLEEMPQHVKTFQTFQNQDEYGNMMVPTDKMDELKRRFTSVRVSAKYHGIKLEYREHRHTVLDLLGQIRTKLRVWKRPYISPEAVRVLLQEWHELASRQELPTLLAATLHKLKQISEKYSSKSALAADYQHVSQQVKQLEEDTAVILEEVTTAKSSMGRVLSSWDSYSDCLSSLQAWLEQGSVNRPELTSESVSEWGSRQAHLNEVGNFLIESTAPQTSRSLAEELRRINMQWAEFMKRNTFDSTAEPSADVQARTPDVQALIREATLFLKEPVEAMAGPLRTYRKRIQFIMMKIKEVDLEALAPSPEYPADQLQKMKLAIPEVMQTLLEAEQVCAELQHSVSGLDSRLAELLHWETEASELYQLLKGAERQQRGQDPRARVLISRGLQLEGQVVTEEQDLQMMVMTNQKNSPLQYVHASAMQDRVRAAVAQSQEAVGMLSSLGARRDRSRSPPEGSPPSKIFIQAKGQPQRLRESDTRQSETKSVTHTFVPKIVVQEYKDEKMISPTMPYSYAEAVMQTRRNSPPEGQAQAWSGTDAYTQPKGQTEKKLQQEQHEVQQQQQQKQEQRVEQHLQTEIHRYQVQQHVVTDIHVEQQVRQSAEHHEQTSTQQPPVRIPPLSPQELKSRKAQAMKNRPWLQKPASGEQKTPGQNLEQDSKETVRSVQVVVQQTVTASSQLEAHAKVTEPQLQRDQQQQQEKEKHQQQLQHLEKHQKQQEQLLQPEQQKQLQQTLPILRQAEPDSDTKAKPQTVTTAQPHPQRTTQYQSQPQTTVHSKSQAAVQAQSTSVTHSTTDSQQPLKAMSQTKVSHGQSQAQVLPQPDDRMKTQSLTQPQTQVQLQPQLQTQPQTSVPAGPQPSTQSQGLPHGPAVAQMQAWTPVRPSSPMQAPLQGQIQPPVPSHIQLRSHPHSWAPVRPPSPKPPTPPQIQTDAQSMPQSQAYPQSMVQVQTHAQPQGHPQTHPQSKVLPQTHPQPKAQSQMHAQSMTQSQTHAQSMVQVQSHPQPNAQSQVHPQSIAQSQIHAQSMVQGQTHLQPMSQPRHANSSTQQTQVQLVVQPQGHSQPMTQYPPHAQPAVQHPGHISPGQIQTWTQVRASSPMSISNPQATAQPPCYPQGYSQGQSPSQQWTLKPESQSQAFSQQKHPIPQPYPQQIGQVPQCQALPTVQGLPQWPQARPQLGPQIGHPGYPHVRPLYPEPQMQPQTQTQPWAQTQPQVRPQSSMQQQQQQQPQMRSYDTFHMQTQQGQVQQQTWVQAPPQLYPQPYPQPQSQKYSQVQHQYQTQHHPHMQAQIPPQSQSPHQAHPHLSPQPQCQPQMQAQSQTHIQKEPSIQIKPQAQTQQPQLNLKFQQSFPQPKHQAQLQSESKTESPIHPKRESPPQPKPQAQLAQKTEFQTPTQPVVQQPIQPKAESVPQPVPEPKMPLPPMTQSPVKAESQPQPKLQVQTAPLPESQSPTQPKVQSLPQPKPQAQLPSQSQLQAQSPPLPKAQTAPPPESQSPTQPKVQSPIQSKAQSMPQLKPQAQLPPQPQPQAQSPPLLKAQTAPQSKAQSPPQARPQTQPLPTLPQSKPQTKSSPEPKPQQPQTVLVSQINVLSESQAESPDLCITPPALAQVPPQAYTEAYAKAQALARNGFEDAKHCLQEHIMETINIFEDKRISTEQASVKEETLRTLDPEMLEEFLRAAKGMEAFCTPSQLREMEFYTQSVSRQWEACISEDGSFAQAGQHLEALKELCDTLSPEDAHRLAQTQLRECENRLAAIQRQFSGDQEAQIPDSRIPVAFSEDATTQKEPIRPTSDRPQVSAEMFQVTMRTVCLERTEVEKQTSVEEEVSKKEALERYENCKRTLQAQLAKNEQSIKDVPSDSVSLKGLHTRLQEIQFLRQETESLWSEYANQCSQCSQFSGNAGLEQEKAELQEQWRSQQSNLQKRGSSLGAALRQIDSTENHMVDFTDRLDRYLRQPKDVTAFTLANTNILKDIKELDDNIQNELDQVSRLDPESSDLDPRDCFPLSREVETHRNSLDQLRQQVRKSEAAARALDRFLMSLRTVDEDISGVQGAPCSDAQVLQDCRSKLALIRQSIDSLKEKAPQLDLLLQGARLTVTRDGVPASCLDMVTALLRRLEEADSSLASQQKGLQKETQSKSLGLRKRTLLGELRKLKDTIEMQGLKEPTMPAVQHRLRALSDLEGPLQVQHAELQNLRELQEKQGGGENLFEEVETEWRETQRAFSDRKKQCNTLLELLKKFQSCRGHLSNTMQRAEQAIGDQASYMGKDNLQRSIAKVHDIKEELAGLGEQMEEMRGVCRQLQSQLKKFPDCSETSFEAEADTHMDNWLDVTEKTDAYMDNLRVGLELWEKQLMVGGEVDSWAGSKLAMFAESHPFHNEQQVLDMKDEIHTNEENIEHFHKKSLEIQEMLQGQEAPLELQVMETQLRKRMQQVTELFTDCTDVFEELVAVKTHLAEKIEECQSAVESIQCSLSKVDASQPKIEAQIQDLCDDLEAQEEQAESVLKEVGLISSVASPQVLEALSVDCSRLREAIARTKELIYLKREERDKGLLKVIKDERQSFGGWFQDLQVSVNECFENPESRTDVETSLQRLISFLKSKDTERRLDQLKDQLERGGQQVPTQQLSEFNDWLKEQQEEVDTFKTHCHNRQKQMESLLSDLNSLQKQHDSFRDWLQTKEKQSVESDKVKLLLKDLQDGSGRVDTLSEVLASVRRQGVRAESLLKDGDNLIQRYRNLEARLQKQADAQSALEGEFDKLNTQAESTRTWITTLLQPLTSHSTDTKTEEMKHKAQAVLSSRPEGDAKVDNLRRQSQSLCEQEDLQEARKKEIQRSVRETEEQWRTAVQTAEQALNKAEAQALLDKDLDAFRTQNENAQSWIREQEQSLQSLGGCMQAEEKCQVAQATLSSKPDGDSKLRNLKKQCQSLCDNQSLDESRRQELQDSVRHTEEQWKKVLQAAEEALNKAETDATVGRDYDDFKTQSESTQSWIKEQKQKLLSHASREQVEERLQAAQAVLSSRPQGESKMLDLKRQSESLCEHLEESRKAEVQQLVRGTEQQWRSVLQAATQAELRALSDDFDTQSKNTQSWIRDQQQKLQSVGIHRPPEERSDMAQTILSSKPDGDCKVNNLRRRGQTLCDRADADKGSKVHVQQTVRETEEQWRTVLQAAKQVEADAGTVISEGAERRRMELREFDTHQQDTGSWFTDLQRRVDSLNSQTRAEDRLHSAQAIMSSKPEGDSKLQELRRRGQSLCGQDLEEHKKQELQQKVRGAEGQWTRVLQNAKQALDQAERQCALEVQLRDYNALRENTRTWLEDKQQNLVSLDLQTEPERTINTAQTILSCKPEGDSKLTELRRQSQSLSDQEDLDENVKRDAQQAVKDSEEQWSTVLQSAENTLKKAEVQYSLSRELEAFRTQAGITMTWVKELQQQAESKGSGTQGSQAQIEDKLNTAKAILSSKSNGEAQVMGLKTRAQSLCEQEDLEGDKKLEVQQTVKDTEEQWRKVLRDAEDTQRQLKGLVERLVSCQCQRGQAEARLSDLQKQISSLPRVFPWPGLGERRQTVEQARTLLDQTTALAPVLSEIRTQTAELFVITQDQSWSDPSWAAKEASIPALLKELTDAVTNLEQGVVTERQCTQLVEQHEAAQDWLREHVKGLGAPPADRQGLHSAVNTLKALLQTVDREQREMKELDSARDSLLSLCTPGGRDALTLEISHLHDLCTTSEQEVKERLGACETRLAELDSQLARKAQGLKERGAALQWELRSLDQALSYSEPQNNIAQLQQHWHSLQNCEKSLEDLGGKVHDLYQEIKATPATDELPTEIITVVESLQQQHDSLKTRLSERQSTCSTNTARCLMDCLHTLQEWNHSKPSESSSSVQVSLEEGEKLQVGLREALSHQQFLSDCLMPVLFEKLEKEGSETLREADTHKASLSQGLKELDERSKVKLHDVLHGNREDTKTSAVAPPRKNKHSSEKKHQVKEQKNIPLTEKSTSIDDEMSVSAELQTEAKTAKPSVTAAMQDIKINVVEQTRIKPTRKKSQSKTSEEQFKSTKQDITAEPVGAEQMEHAVDEPDLIQKIIEQSAPGASEKTTPVPSRRKSKTSATYTEPIKVKTITQGSPRNQTGTTVVEEIKNIATIVLDVSEPFTAGPVTTDVAGELNKKAQGSLKSSIMTEQAETMVVEEAKLGPTTKESKSPNVSSKVSVAKPAQIKGDAENETTQLTTQPVETSVLGESNLSPTKRKSKRPKLSPELSNKEKTHTTMKPECQLGSKEQTEAVVVEDETKVIRTRRKSNSLDISTVPETTVEKSNLVKESEKSSAADFVPESTKLDVLEPSKILPPKRKSKSPKLPMKQADQKAAQTEEPESQRSALSLREQSESVVMEETKIIPTRRKSKSAELSTTLQQVEPEDNRKEPDGLKSSSTPQVVTETVVVKEKQLSPTKRRSKGLKLPPEHANKEVTVTKQESGSQKPSVSSSVPTETVIEETKNIATIILDVSEPFTTVPVTNYPKVKVSTVPESISHLGIITCVAPEETKQKTENDCVTTGFIQGQSQTSVVEQSKFVPPKRKSKSTGLDLKLDDTDAPQTMAEPEGQKSCLSSNEQNVSEETKLIPTRKKSKSGDFSMTSKAVTNVRSTDVEKGVLSPAQRQTKGVEPLSELVTTELTHVKEIPGSHKPASTPEVVTATTEITVVEKGKPSPPKRKSKGVEPSKEPVTKELTETKERSDSSKPSSTSEMVPTTYEISVVEKGTLSPTPKMSTGVEPLTELVTKDLTKTKETSDSEKPSSSSEVVPATYEMSVVVEKGVLSPTPRKSTGVEPLTELVTKDLTKTTEISDSEKPCSTSDVVPATYEMSVVVEKGDLSPTPRKSTGVEPSTELVAKEQTKTKEDPDSEKATSTSEVVPATYEMSVVVEKGSLSPTPRKSTGVEPLAELVTKDLTKTKETPDSEKLSSTSEVVPATNEISVVVAEGMLSPTDRQPTAVQPPAELVPTKLTSTKEEPSSQKSSLTPEMAQTEPLASTMSTDTPHVAEYIDNMMKNAVEIQKRYLVLDLPEIGVTQTYEIKPHRPEAETVIEIDSTQPPSAVFSSTHPHKAEIEFSETILSEQDLMKPSDTLNQLKLSQEQPREDMEQGVHKVSTLYLHDAPKSLEEKLIRVEEIHKEAEVHVDTQTGQTQCKTEPQSKDIISTDIQPEKAAAKIGRGDRVEVQETISKCEDNVAKGDFSQPTTVFAAVQESESETQLLQISLSEHDTGKPGQQLELLRTTQGRPKDVKDFDIQEEHGKVLTHDVHDTPKCLDESSVKEILLRPEVRVLQLDIQTSPEQENTSVTSAKVIDIVQTSIQSERMSENEDITTADVTPEKDAVEKTALKMKESSAEDGVPNIDFPASSESLQPHVTETEFIEINIYDQDIVKPSQTETKIEPLKTTQNRPSEVKDHGDQEEHPEVSVHGMPNVLKSLDEKSVKEGGIHINVHECKTVMESSIQYESVKESKAVTSTDNQSDKPAVRMTSKEVQESFTESLSEPGVVLKAQTERHKTDAKENKKEDQNKAKKKTTQEEQSENMVKVEIQNVPLPMATTTTTGEMRLQSMDSPQEVDKAGMASPTSTQTVQKSSTDIVCGEVTMAEGVPSQENKTKEEASVVATENLVLEVPEESAMGNLFAEVQLLAGTGPNSKLIEGKPLEDAPESLMTSTSDLKNRLNRLVSKVLSCKNNPAELNPTVMAQQLEEAQECTESAQAQVAWLFQLRGADAENRDTLELVEDQWCTAAQDAAAVSQSKESQLQVVTEYCRQTQAAKTTLEGLTAELDAVRKSPEESSTKEAERLSSLQRSIEDNRTVLGEMLVTHTKLCPHLSRSERTTAQAEQRNLQEAWRGLEKAVERTLFHTNINAHETSSLLSVLSSLQEHLKTISKDLETKSASDTQWNCKKAQELMEANAEVKAAQQKYLHLQQLSEVVILSSRWENETKEIQQGLQGVKDELCHTEELVSSQTQTSSNPIMEKIIVVMRDGLAWAKQTESDIEGRRKRVALLPEEVHRQLRDLKKLQSEVMAKQGQLESLVEEMTEFLPQLDQAEEVPMVRSTLESFEQLSKSTTDKLAMAVREIESGLQTREKLSEQIADLDSWVVAHLHREASRSSDDELRTPIEFDRRVRQVQETLVEAEKQAAVCEALLMKTKDIASELSITENCQLSNKLTSLQEDIHAISSYEKANKKELDELIQCLDLSNKDLVTVEKNIRQMLVDLTRHRYPITRESLQALEPYKHMILEHKSQVDFLQPWIPKDKTRELYSIIAEIHRKMAIVEMKSIEHERYLYMRQCVEDLREDVGQQGRQTKEDSKEPEEKYKLCQTLLAQIPLIKYLSEEAHSKLQMIAADLYPSQLTTERQRLKQNKESIETLEVTLYNNLSIIETKMPYELDFDSEKKAAQAFLWKTQQELQIIPTLEPNETMIKSKYRRIVSLKRTVESRMRALEVLKQKKGSRQGSELQNLMDLKKAVLSECDSHMGDITQARESLRSYTCAVRQAAQFLSDIEVCLLPPQGSAGLCSDRLQETQQALTKLQEQFQTHVEQLQNQAPLHPHLCPQKVEQLQENILSQLLVRMSTLQAKGHIQLECLNRCAENHRKYTKCQEEIMQSVKSAGYSLSEVIRQKVICLADCTDQETRFRALSEELESLQGRLEELKEWCPEQSCCRSRVATVTALWKRVSRLLRCTHELTARSKQRIEEWSEITNSVEKASVVLEQVEAELPDNAGVKASTEELQDLLQSWEQYPDRLDCEHRALSALELRTATLLGVPAHLEEAPPTPLCQRLQAMQARYSSVKQRTREGLEAARMELEEREKVHVELQGIQVWLEAADDLLSEMEQSSSTQELQEVHSQLCTQKALLQRIMETLKMKYSDMYTLVPVEIEGQVQEVKQSLQHVEVKVGEALERSDPVNRLGAKLSEIQAGLRSVQKRLEKRSPDVTQAKITQKRVWDELDVWHSCLAALEMDMHDLENPEEALHLTERLVEVQQLHSQLAKQAEQRTTLISKIHNWLQEHQEMIKSSQSWMAEAQSWLAAPCTYTTAKSLSTNVQALQMVLDDSAQIRTTLQGFSSVLKEMSQVCDIATLQEQLIEADSQVAFVQDSFIAPLSQLEHAAAEVEAIESEVKKMEDDVAEIKTILSSPESFPSPREESLKALEQRIQSMRRTIAEIQKCKPDLCLPDKSEETLTVFTVVDQLQTLLLELEKKVPALFIQQPPTPVQIKAVTAHEMTSQPQFLKSTSVEAEKEEEQGQIMIAHVEVDVLRRSGATLLTVEQSSPEQRKSWTPESTQREHGGVLQAEEAIEKKGRSEEQRVEEGGRGVLWWLWDTFLAASPEEPLVVPEETAEAATEQSTEQTGEDRPDVEGPTDTTEASSSEALSKPLATVTTQSLPESMVNTQASTINVSKSDSGAQQKCVVS